MALLVVRRRGQTAGAAAATTWTMRSRVPCCRGRRPLLPCPTTWTAGRGGALLHSHPMLRQSTATTITTTTRRPASTRAWPALLETAAAAAAGRGPADLQLPKYWRRPSRSPTRTTSWTRRCQRQRPGTAPPAAAAGDHLPSPLSRSSSLSPTAAP
ncbi:unnamed protein product [Ectocarpus sp. 4 AP-2014]